MHSPDTAHAAVSTPPSSAPPPAGGRLPIGGWALAAAIAALLAIVYFLRLVLMPFVLAAAVAYVSTPLIHWMQRRLRFPRWMAALSIFITLLGILFACGTWAGRAVIPETIQLLTNAPQIVHETIANLFGEHLSFFGQPTTAAELTQRVMGSAQGVLGAPGPAIQAAMLSVEAIMGLILTLVLLAYFLLDGPRIGAGILWLFPPRLRPQMVDLGRRMDPILGRYIRGLVIIVLYASLVTWIGLGLVLHWKHAVLLAVVTGVLELIPSLGPAASTVLLSLVALRQGNLWMIGGFAIFTTILRVTIDQVVGPWVLGRAATLHPVAVIFSFLVGGVLFGILGVLLAVPVAATIKIALETAYEGPGHLHPRPPSR